MLLPLPLCCVSSTLPRCPSLSVAMSAAASSASPVACEKCVRPGDVQTGTPAGRIEQYAGVEAYVTGSSKDAAIIYCTDIFGHKSDATQPQPWPSKAKQRAPGRPRGKCVCSFVWPHLTSPRHSLLPVRPRSAPLPALWVRFLNHQLLADKYAAAGFTVVIPNTFKSGPMSTDGYSVYAMDKFFAVRQRGGTERDTGRRSAALPAPLSSRPCHLTHSPAESVRLPSLCSALRFAFPTVVRR